MLQPHPLTTDMIVYLLNLNLSDVPITIALTIAITLGLCVVLRFLIKAAISGAKKQKKLNGQLIKITVSFGERALPRPPWPCKH